MPPARRQSPRPARTPRTTRASRSGAGGGQPVALVVDAGGARSAYQVGALEVLLPELERRGCRPRVVVGTSAGALLAAALASTAHLPAVEQAARLTAVLDQAVKPRVMRPFWQQVPVVAVRYASETLGLSGLRLRGFFGTGPLARTLATAIDWNQLHRNVSGGVVDSVSVSATAVRTGNVVMFTEGRADVPAPRAGHRTSYAAVRLAVEHVMASAAIPAIFPAVHVTTPAHASGWYVDGATRRTSPVAPALDLGAERVVVVGTGSLHGRRWDKARDDAEVDIADAGVALLGAVMDDPLRDDLDRLADVNAWSADRTVAAALGRHRRATGREPYRVVPYVAVAPHFGDEIAALAMDVFRANHGSLRGTLLDPDLHVVHRLLGSDSPLQGEMLSYLLFDRDFFAGVAELGRRDALRWLDENPDLWRTEALPRPAGPV